jgi:hypothetical protein
MFKRVSDEEIKARNKCVSFFSKFPLLIELGPKKKNPQKHFWAGRIRR